MNAARKLIVVGVVGLFATLAMAEMAYSCVRCSAGASPGRGCGQLVTVKHPDLKGPSRKKEWDKCMANPDAYGKI
jgi:hypothetical protein